MLRRGARPAAVALLVAAAWPASASAEDFLLYLDAGLSIPAAPPELPDFWNPGLSLGGGVGVRLSPFWEIATDVHYQRFPADERAQIDGLLLSGPGGVLPIQSIDGRDAEATAILTEVRVHPGRAGARVDPFLAFGAGYFQISTTDATVTPAPSSGVDPITIVGDSDTALAAAIGGGLQIHAGTGWRVVLDAIYTIGFTEQSSTEFIPLRVGVAREL
ncbi:MAG: outer membrane beta-barrel protein [bacterium]